jgi:hypothetical protein
MVEGNLMEQNKSLDFARRLAAVMPGWSAVAKFDRISWLNGPDGLSLNIGVSCFRSDGHAEIAGNYPDVQSRYYPKDTPKIGVSTSRDITAVARDIERRLLPDVRDYLALVIAVNTSYENAATSLAASVASMVAMPGVSDRSHGGSSNRLPPERSGSRIVDWQGRGGYGEIQFNQDGSMVDRLELCGLAPNQVQAALQAIAQVP